MPDKIDNLQVQSSNFDIDLPPDATPSIKKIEVYGNINTYGIKAANNESSSKFFTPGGHVVSPSLVTLVPGSNISITKTGTTNSSYVTISGTDNNTWQAVSASQPGYLYRYNFYTASASNSGAWYGELKITSAVVLRVAVGLIYNLSRDASGTYSFRSNFFSSAPTIQLGFRHDSSEISEYIELTSPSSTGFTYNLQKPSGTGSNSACQVNFIAYEFVGSMS